MSFDEKFMKLAIGEAMLSGQNIPIGAVLVSDDEKIIAKAHNDSKITEHAEILCINNALAKLSTSNLSNCTLYSTLEPCFMCAGAIKLSKLSKLVFGAFNQRDGAVGSVYDVLRSPDNPYNSNIQVLSGVLETECSALLKNFDFGTS